MHKISRRTNQVTETKYITSKLIVGGKMEEKKINLKKKKRGIRARKEKLRRKRSKMKDGRNKTHYVNNHSKQKWTDKLST